MKRHKAIIILAVLVFAVLLLSTVGYVVDETNDIVLITTFGNITKVQNGADAAGLHFKWPYPIQRLIRYDRREHVLNSSFRQLQIGEKNNVTATVFCTWQIKDAETFYKAKRNRASIDDAIRALLSSAMTGVMGSVKMEQLVNTDPKAMELQTIEADIKKRVAPRVLNDYGIELTAVGIKALGLPKSVTEQVIKNMTEERNKEAEKLKADGEAVAAAIEGRAKAARDMILAFANNKAGVIRAQGERKAAEAYAQFQKHPEFSMFLRSVESLRASLKNRTVFILDANTMPILNWLRSEPILQTFQQQPAPQK